MQEAYKTIYEFARNVAGFTRLQAIERLNISIRSLADYESGKTVPNSDIVADMAEVYRTRWLGYEHLRTSSRLGLEVLPVIKFDDIAKSVLVLQKESSDVEEVRNSMIDIACDGEIEHHEKRRWSEVTKEVRELAGAALSVVYSR